MKKLFAFAGVLCLSAVAAFGQVKTVANFKSATNATAIDTVVNTATKNQDLKVSRPADVLAIQVIATKISGTTAGVVRLFGSNDGSTWVRIKAGAALAATDSLNLANVSTPQTIVFYDNPSRWLYYRAQIVGAGTASTRFNTVAVGAK